METLICFVLKFLDGEYWTWYLVAPPIFFHLIYAALVAELVSFCIVVFFGAVKLPLSVYEVAVGAGVTYPDGVGVTTCGSYVEYDAVGIAYLFVAVGEAELYGEAEP